MGRGVCRLRQPGLRIRRQGLPGLRAGRGRKVLRGQSLPCQLHCIQNFLLRQLRRAALRGTVDCSYRAAWGGLCLENVPHVPNPENHQGNNRYQ